MVWTRPYDCQGLSAGYNCIYWSVTTVSDQRIPYMDVVVPLVCVQWRVRGFLLLLPFHREDNTTT